MPISNFLIPLTGVKDDSFELLDLLVKLHAPSLPDVERFQLVREIAALMNTVTNTMGVVGWTEGISDYERNQKQAPLPESFRKAIEARDRLIAELRVEITSLRDTIRRGQENERQPTHEDSSFSPDATIPSSTEGSPTQSADADEPMSDTELSTNETIPGD